MATKRSKKALARAKARTKRTKGGGVGASRNLLRRLAGVKSLGRGEG